MPNELLNQIVQEALQEDINCNGVPVAVEELVQPVNIVANPRQVPRRNENYYEEVIPRYTPDDFWCHFRMSRATYQLLLNELPRGQESRDHTLFEKKLLFSIWMLAKPESCLAAGDRFDLAPGTGHTFFFEMINQNCQLRHDVIIWPNQNEREKFSRELKKKSNIPGIIGEIEAEAIISPTEHLLGDSAYPLSHFLLTPYRDNGHLTFSQVTFNTRMSSVRVLIEQAFELLKCKFRRLKYLDMAKIDMVPAVM